jgi:hypothetical protein
MGGVFAQDQNAGSSESAEKGQSNSKPQTRAEAQYIIPNFASAQGDGQFILGQVGEWGWGVTAVSRALMAIITRA